MSQEEKPRKQQYGLISMISIIIGTVIGSGIYVKNASIIDTTQSAILAMIAWVVAGLLVLAILIAVLEIASITSKKNEQGTLNSWTRYFWGPRTAMFVNSYFLFIYFPLVVSSESVFAASQLFTDRTFSHQLNGFFIISFIAAIFITFAFYLAINFVKTTKGIMGIGSTVKLIPLIFVVILMVLIGLGLTVGDGGDSLNPIFDPDAPINSGMEGGGFNDFMQVFLALPAILFAFDGFLYAASLSTEAKSQKTYKSAAIIAIIIIILIYLLFSISTYAIADAQTNPDGTLDGNSFKITQVVSSVFGNASWLLPTISIIISLSIVTAIFGYAIVSMWTLADGSNTNEIVDKNGTLIRRSKNRNPYKAGYRMLICSLFALIFMRGYDLIAIFATTEDSAYAYIGMTDYISNLYSVLDFTFYTLIIVGGLMNRKTNKVDVDKSKIFIPAAIFAIVGMSLVVMDMSYDIFNELYQGISSNDRSELNFALIKLSSIIAIIGSTIGIYFYQKHNLRRQSDDIWKDKTPYQQAYRSHMTFEEYVVSIK